jgi:hypothetical protein
MYYVYVALPQLVTFFYCEAYRDGDWRYDLQRSCEKGIDEYLNSVTASYVTRKLTQTYSGQANSASKIKDNCEFKWSIQTFQTRVQNGQWIVIKIKIS